VIVNMHGRTTIKNDVSVLQKLVFLCVISGFRREADENCALLVVTQRVVVIPY
jgi:hypothetical protein